MSTTTQTLATPAVAGRRYTATAQALHWITAVLMFIAIPLAWVMVSMPRTDPGRAWIIDLHRSVGMTILAFAVVRLVWRAVYPAPPLPSSMAPWERTSAFASHWLLYFVLIAMPVSGFILSSAGGHDVTWFGLFTFPGLSENKKLSEAAVAVHATVGQWVVYALILLHVGATAWHVAVRRDGVLERMLPEQKPER